MDGKILIVYYSLEGNTKIIAEKIASKLQADILQLKPMKDINPQGFSRYIWGGKQVITKKKPELEAFELNPEEYEMIIIGTPVWAGSFAPAVRSFIEAKIIDNKKVAIFCTHRGGLGKIFEHFKSRLEPYNDIIDMIDLKDVQNDTEENEEKIELFCKNIKDEN